MTTIHTQSHSNCIYNTGCVPPESLRICICCMINYIQTNIASRAPATPNFHRCFSPKSKAKPSEKTSCSWSSSMLWAGERRKTVVTGKWLTMHNSLAIYSHLFHQKLVAGQEVAVKCDPIHVIAFFGWWCWWVIIQKAFRTTVLAG